MNKVVELSPSQMEFLGSATDYTLFCGGVGSGKTHGGAVWALTMALKYPGTKGLITANSYSQLKKATLSKFFQILHENDIDYKYKSQDGIIEINGTEIYCISMEKYDLLRGIEIGWAWSDECAFYKPEAFDVLIGRIRDNKGPCLWKGTTTPNGFNWLYTKFVETPLPGSSIVTGKTMDNLGNLGKNYLSTLTAQYDSRLARQELDGEFVNLTSGKVYYGFDRLKHVQRTDDVNRLIWIGMDFNVDPLCGVYCYESNGKIYVTKELYQRDSNTFKAAKEILQQYRAVSVNIVADDSGTKRKTSSSNTDYEILRRANLNVEKFRNPRVKDRYNNINRLFDHGLLFIDPNCKKLIEDLEKLTYDNVDPMLSHISDALGYVCWKLNPLRKPSRPASITYR